MPILYEFEYGIRYPEATCYRCLDADATWTGYNKEIDLEILLCEPCKMKLERNSQNA